MRGEVENRDESMRSEHICGGVAGETGWGDACWWVREARSLLRQAGQFQPMGEPAEQI